MVPYDPEARARHHHRATATATAAASSSARVHVRNCDFATLLSQTIRSPFPARRLSFFAIHQKTTLAELVAFSRAAVGEGNLVESVAVLAPRYPPLPPPAERDGGDLPPAVGIRIVGARAGNPPASARTHFALFATIHSFAVALFTAEATVSPSPKFSPPFDSFIPWIGNLSRRRHVER